MARSLSESSRSILFKAASALFSWICQFWVRRSFSPKESAAFWRAARRNSTLFFCASISLFSTVFLAESACTDLSFLSNCEDTSFISEPSTLKDWLISDSAFLNSFSPSMPIFRPKLSATGHTSSLRPHGLHIPRFRVNTKTRSFRHSSSPQKAIRLSGDPVRFHRESHRQWSAPVSALRFP